MNSFTNSKNKKKNRRRGFTLTELLVVIAIIAIFVSLSIVGINKYQRSLKLVEMDGLAKEIYVTAQNNLTTAFGQSYLGISSDSFGTKDPNVDASLDVYYYIINGDYEFKTAANASTALDLMLPQGSIDSTVLSNGNFIIRYQRSTGTVLDVFYVPAEGFRFSHTFTADDYKKLVYPETEDLNYRTHDELRKNFGQSVVGYAGNYEGALKSVNDNDDDNSKLKSPTVRGVNDNMLYAVVTFPNVDTGEGGAYEGYTVEKMITVTGEDGQKVTFVINEESNTVTRIAPDGKETTFPLDETSQLRKVTTDTEMPGDVTVPAGSYILVLDDITTKNQHFTDLYPSTEGWTPGEDLTIQAEIKLQEKETNVNYSEVSNKVVVNSLFGSLDDEDKTNGTEVTVDNIRHLENLDSNVSGFDPKSLPVKVEQKGDIDFNDFKEDFNGKEIGKKGGADGESDPNTFAPIDINYQIEYDGNDNAIENLEVKTEGDAGLFGNLNGGGSVIKDLEIINPNIYSYDGNAGSLVATVTGVATNKITISGVVAYNARPLGETNWSDSSLKVHASWNAGGLIGSGKFVNVNSSAAAVYVESNGSNNSGSTDDTGYSNAGGFIGYVESSSITGCYAGGHTVSGKYLSTFTSDQNGRVNVVATNYTGGFAAITKNSTIQCSYTTCSAGCQSGYVAGYSAYISADSTLKYCYTVGRVVGSSADYAYNFCCNDYTFTGNNNHYLKHISTDTNTALTDVYSKVTGISVESGNRDVISYTASRKTANTYDNTVLVNFEGKYYFLTVDQLYQRANLTGTSAPSKDGITNVQYGDWQVPNGSATYSYFDNGDTLKLWVEIESILTSGETKLTVGIKGETSGHTRALLFDLSNAKPNQVIKYTPGYVSAAGDITWVTKSADSQVIPAVVDSSGKYLVITLDDITTSGKHFCELFGNKLNRVADADKPLTALTPGENIIAYTLSGVTNSASQLYSAEADKTNSLFDYEAVDKNSGIRNNTNIMYISNVRHLQNMEPSISGLTQRTSEAYICADLTWGEPFSSGIYSKNSKTIYYGFVGILYQKISFVFEGQGHTLSNFKFAPIYTDYSCFCGLFRYIDCVGQTIEINDLIILNPTVCADTSTTSSDLNEALKAYASPLIPYIHEYGKLTLTIDSVSVIDNTDDAATTYSIIAKGKASGVKAAGGLIGCVEPGSDSEIVIKNSSVSANIMSCTSTGTVNSNYAGGLIGKLGNGTLTITNSYVGGHTISDSTSNWYSTDYYNIVGGQAGSFIGSAETTTSKTATIQNSFTTASVKGSHTSGSFIGTLLRPLVLDNVYTTAPVAGITSGKSKAGALIGWIRGSSDSKNGAVTIVTDKDSGVYYFPECYDKVVLSAEEQFETGSNNVTGSAQAVYYDTETGKISTADAQKNVTIKKGTTVVRTHPFDEILVTKDKEYPFISWTTSPYSNESGMMSFIGDWVANGISEASTKTATFYYMNDGTSTLVTPSNNIKEFQSGSDAEIIVPAMDSENLGYKAYAWYLGDKITDVDNFDFETWKASATPISSEEEWLTGSITIASGLTRNDCSIVVLYNTDESASVVKFYYDKNNSNNYTDAANIVKLGKTQVVTKLSDVVVPECSADGLTFVGWYSDIALTSKINFKDNTTLAQGTTINAYAKFGSPYTVTITYYYEDGDDLVPLFSNPSVKTYLTGDGLQTITLLGESNNLLRNAYTLDYLAKDSITGTRVETTKSGNTNTFTLESEASASYVAVYKPSSTAFKKNYVVKYVFEHTSDDWSYNESSTKTLTYPTDGTTYQTDNGSDLLRMGAGGVTFSEFMKNQTITVDGTQIAWSDGFIITDLPTSTEDANGLVTVTVNVQRRTYTLSADANTGAYIEPVEVEFGKNLYSVIGSATLTRNGYTFPTNFEDRWKYYKLGETSSSAKQVTTGTTMPAYDTVLYANWNPGTSTYNVVFWFENADDTDYSYGGSIVQSGTTGSTVSTDEWNTLDSLSSGSSSHVHSVSCFAGATNVQFTYDYEGDDPCDDGEKYWEVNGKRLKSDSTPDQRSNATDGQVFEFTYQSGGTVKGIKIGDTWYVYNGSVASGGSVSCTGQTTTWVTTDYKTYFEYYQGKSYLESSDGKGNETISEDGTTTLNVYYSRNRYHLYVELDNGNYEHTHTNYTGSCYTLTCGLLADHTHTTSCLSCELTEHTHENCTITHRKECYVTESGQSIFNNTIGNCGSDEVNWQFSNVLSRITNAEDNYVYKVHRKRKNYSLSGYQYYYYYVRLDGVWYYIGESESSVTDIGLKWSSSSENSLGKLGSDGYLWSKSGTECTCIKSTHDDSYYNCGMQYHVHSDENGCYGKCTALGSHVHTEDCYSLTCKLAECSASDGKNFAVILNAKYQQSINDVWNEYVVSKLSGKAASWRDYTSSWSNGRISNYFSSSYYLSTIDIMPGQDVYLHYSGSSNTYITLYYYLQTPGNAKTSTSTNVNGYNFELYKSAKIEGDSWTTSFTLDEEFSLINGFTRYAYKYGNNSVSTNVTSFHGKSLNDTNLYYTRDSYTLELWVDGVVYKSYSKDAGNGIQSEVVLDSYCITPSHDEFSNVPDDYVFSGWYYDKECTQPYKKGQKMPQSNYVLYAKWEPPTKTVSFFLSENDTSVWKTVQTQKYSTLEGIITDSSTNEYKSEYIPDKGNFAYWYYKDGNTNKRFIPQKQIADDMELYAAYVDETEDAKVTVLYKCGSDEISTAAEYTYTVGGLFMISAKTISNYEITGWRYGTEGSLNEDATASILVSSDEDSNVIVFEYEPEVTWSYTVKYVALYKSQATGTVSGVELSEDNYEIEISTSTKTESSLSKSDSRIVEFALPSGYSNYTLDHITVDGDLEDSGISYEYVAYKEGTLKREIIFYITPDKNKCVLSNIHATYDGNDHRNDISVDKLGTLPSFGEGVDLSLVYSSSNESAIHAGAYKINVSGVITVDGHSYLLWNSDDKNVSLIIDPLTIKLKSASASQKYDPDTTLTKNDITTDVINNDADDEDYGKSWTTAFCGSDADYFEPVFTVESFRHDVGSSENAFSMQLKSDTPEAMKVLLDDYLIDTEFGMLTVKWKYDVEYRFRYRSTVGEAIPDTKELSIASGAETVDNVTSSTATVTVTLPSIYKNCRLCYSYAGNDVVLGSNSSYDVEISTEVLKDYTENDNAASSKLIVYIEPNVDLVSAYIPTVGKSVTYNGIAQYLDAITIDEDLFKNCDQTETITNKLILETKYEDKDGNPVEEPKDATTYYSTSNLYLAVTEGAETKKYLIASDTSKTVQLKIDPLDVTVTSPDSSAYIDVDGTIVFAGGDVELTSGLVATELAKLIMDDPDQAVYDAESGNLKIAADTVGRYFDVVYSDNGHLNVGVGTETNTEGNYFTLEWKSGVNSDNFNVTRVYGDLDLKWRTKVTYCVRPDNTAAIDSIENYSGKLFDRTGTAYQLTAAAYNGAYLEFDSDSININDYLSSLTVPEGFKLSTDYSYNNVVHNYADNDTLSPNQDVYGNYGANELVIYITPDTSSGNIASAVSSASSFATYSANLDWSSLGLSDVTSVSVSVPDAVIVGDGQQIVATPVAGTEYTRYSYVILEVTTSTGTKYYLLDYASEPYTGQ